MSQHETQTEAQNIRNSIAELISDLGSVGVLMLSEVRASLEHGLNASQADFRATVDRVAESMKQSRDLAAEDIDKASERIKANWELLQKENTEEWERFLAELETRLKAMDSLSRDTFNLAVDQAKRTVERQWEATGKLGESQLQFFEARTEAMADAFKQNRDAVLEKLQKTTDRFDRAIRAALEELKK